MRRMLYEMFPVCIFLATIWHQVGGDQCVFSTAVNLKAPNIIVNESFIVRDFNNDCEFLCYKHPTRCLAANLIPLQNHTYLCEFATMKVTSEYLSALESNFGGKYFFRIPVVQRRLNVASINEGATCETSSDYNKNYGCRNALDGQKTTNSPEWATFRQDVGAWINISLSAARLVTNINLYRRSNNRKEDASRVNVYFSNGGIEGIETPFCSSENGNNILAELDIDPVITDYVITVIADACQETVNVGFREVEIYALV